MKPISATLLAVAVSASFASVSAFAQSNDPATYRTITQKAAADYKTASATCKDMSGNARNVCMEEAKVARARAENDAVAQYNNTVKDRTRTRTALANAEYALAKVKCAAMTGADKDNCVNNARSVHTAALADAKNDRNISIAGTSGNAGPVAGTDTRDPAKAAAVDKCAQVAGQPNTGCLIDNRSATTTTATTGTGMTAGTPVASVAQKAERAAETAADKTRGAAATVADKTERTAETVAAKTEQAAEKTGAAVADSVITTKVKAEVFKEPELKSMAIHVETEKGVVMLSGFVDSKADAEKAVTLARGVEGVTEVKSAIKVK